MAKLANKLSDVAKIAIPSGFSERKADVVRHGIRHILHVEAEEVAKRTSIPDEPHMSPRIVMECILYMTLRAKDQSISWESHASNYWVCDGIIQDTTHGGRSAWEISEALKRNVGAWIFVLSVLK